MNGPALPRQLFYNLKNSPDSSADGALVPVTTGFFCGGRRFRRWRCVLCGRQSLNTETAETPGGLSVEGSKTRKTQRVSAEQAVVRKDPARRKARESGEFCRLTMVREQASGSARVVAPCENAAQGHDFRENTGT
jgi:hypothetical protein